MGVQKGGTTALHKYLSRHSQILMSDPKELHFFDNEEHDWSASTREELEIRLPRGDAVVRGEATPIYTWWPGALERLRAHSPDAQLIMMLRHPTFRAFSHWRMEHARGREWLSFEDAISTSGRRRSSEAPNGISRVFSYVERGFYAPQVKSLQRLFAKEQVLFVLTDDLWLQPAATLSEIEAFLGLEHELGLPREYVAPIDTRGYAELDSRTRVELDRIYRSDILEVASLTGIDLDSWLAPSYEEPAKSTY